MKLLKMHFLLKHVGFSSQLCWENRYGYPEAKQFVMDGNGVFHRFPSSNSWPFMDVNPVSLWVVSSGFTIYPLFPPDMNLIKTKNDTIFEDTRWTQKPCINGYKYIYIYRAGLYLPLTYLFQAIYQGSRELHV